MLHTGNSGTSEMDNLANKKNDMSTGRRSSANETYR